MTPSPTQRLLAIDQAIRLPTPGDRLPRSGQDRTREASASDPHADMGLAELIQQDPELGDWLAWVCTTTQARTCGALEELATEREISAHDTKGQLTTGEMQFLVIHEGRDAPPLILLAPNGQPLQPGCSSKHRLCFTIASDGEYKLTTSDGTLLWHQALLVGTARPSSPTTEPDHGPDGDAKDTTSDVPREAHPGPGVWRLAAAGPRQPPFKIWTLSDWSLSLALYRSETGFDLEVLHLEEATDG